MEGISKFVSLGGLLQVLLTLPDNIPRSVVFTTGVFDVPHVGHPRYLTAAKRLGNVLVVGVHSDELVKERKGEGRPIYPLAERVELLSYYACVDFVLELKDQDDVYAVIELLNPNILVVSETTEDAANSPATMLSLFGKSMQVIVLDRSRPDTRPTSSVKTKEEIKQPTKKSPQLL